MEVTSFQSKVNAFFAVTVLRRSKHENFLFPFQIWELIRCRVNGNVSICVAYESTWLYMQIIASSLVFVAVETWLPSRCLATGAWLCLHYCGFQALCHSITERLLCMTFTYFRCKFNVTNSSVVSDILIDLPINLNTSYNRWRHICVHTHHLHFSPSSFEYFRFGINFSLPQISIVILNCNSSINIFSLHKIWQRNQITDCSASWVFSCVTV
jgi:hypothetical protein